MRSRDYVFRKPKGYYTAVSYFDSKLKHIRKVRKQLDDEGKVRRQLEEERIRQEQQKNVQEYEDKMEYEYQQEKQKQKRSLQQSIQHTIKLWQGLKNNNMDTSDASTTDNDNAQTIPIDNNNNNEVVVVVYYYINSILYLIDIIYQQIYTDIVSYTGGIITPRTIVLFVVSTFTLLHIAMYIQLTTIVLLNEMNPNEKQQQQQLQLQQQQLILKRNTNSTSIDRITIDDSNNNKNDISRKTEDYILPTTEQYHSMLTTVEVGKTPHPQLPLDDGNYYSNNNNNNINISDSIETITYYDEVNKNKEVSSSRIDSDEVSYNYNDKASFNEEAIEMDLEDDIHHHNEDAASNQNNPVDAVNEEKDNNDIENDDDDDEINNLMYSEDSVPNPMYDDDFYDEYNYSEKVSYTHDDNARTNHQHSVDAGNKGIDNDEEENNNDNDNDNEIDSRTSPEDSLPDPIHYNHRQNQDATNDLKEVSQDDDDDDDVDAPPNTNQQQNQLQPVDDNKEMHIDDKDSYSNDNNKISSLKDHEDYVPNQMQNDYHHDEDDVNNDFEEFSHTHDVDNKEEYNTQYIYLQNHFDDGDDDNEEINIPTYREKSVPNPIDNYHHHDTDIDIDIDIQANMYSDEVSHSNDDVALSNQRNAVDVNEGLDNKEDSSVYTNDRNDDDDFNSDNDEIKSLTDHVGSVLNIMNDNDIHDEDQRAKLDAEAGIVAHDDASPNQQHVVDVIGRIDNDTNENDGINSLPYQKDSVSNPIHDDDHLHDEVEDKETYSDFEEVSHPLDDTLPNQQQLVDLNEVIDNGADDNDDSDFNEEINSLTYHEVSVPNPIHDDHNHDEAEVKEVNALDDVLPNQHHPLDANDEIGHRDDNKNKNDEINGLNVYEDSVPNPIHVDYHHEEAELIEANKDLEGGSHALDDALPNQQHLVDVNEFINNGVDSNTYDEIIILSYHEDSVPNSIHIDYGHDEAEDKEDSKNLEVVNHAVDDAVPNQHHLVDVNKVTDHRSDDEDIDEINSLTYDEDSFLNPNHHQDKAELMEASEDFEEASHTLDDALPNQKDALDANDEIDHDDDNNNNDEINGLNVHEDSAPNPIHDDHHHEETDDKEAKKDIEEVSHALEAALSNQRHLVDVNEMIDNVVDRIAYDEINILSYHEDSVPNLMHVDHDHDEADDERANKHLKVVNHALDDALPNQQHRVNVNEVIDQGEDNDESSSLKYRRESDLNSMLDNEKHNDEGEDKQANKDSEEVRHVDNEDASNQQYPN